MWNDIIYICYVSIMLYYVRILNSTFEIFIHSVYTNLLLIVIGEWLDKLRNQRINKHKPRSLNISVIRKNLMIPKNKLRNCNFSIAVHTVNDRVYFCFKKKFWIWEKYTRENITKYITSKNKEMIKKWTKIKKKKHTFHDSSILQTSLKFFNTNHRNTKFLKLRYTSLLSFLCDRIYTRPEQSRTSRRQKRRRKKRGKTWWISTIVVPIVLVENMYIRETGRRASIFTADRLFAPVSSNPLWRPKIN